MTKPDPNPVRCPYCDFGVGRRGVDACGKCQGTGSGFRVGTAFCPNTKEGYDAAVAKLEGQAND